MQFLVSAKWIEGEAKERGISATPAEVDRQFEETKDQSFPNEKAYKRFLRTSGQTEEDLKFRVRLDVLSNKIRQQVTEYSQNVSNDEVEDYYNDNSQQFSQPERRDLEVVLSKKQEDVLEAKQRVEGGERWSKVAKELSDDPASKEQGGKLLGVTKGQQDPKLDAAVFAAVEKKVAGPIKTDAGYYVFRVTKITKATKQSLEQSTQGIRQLLVSQKQQKELDQFSKDFRNDWRARTDCATDYTIADCRNGREEDQAATPPLPPGQKAPVPGSTGANPPALDGTGSTLAGGNGNGTVIGVEQRPAGGQFGLPGGAPAEPRLRSHWAARPRTVPPEHAPGRSSGRANDARRRRRPAGAPAGSSSRAAGRAPIRQPVSQCREPRTSGCAKRCSSSTRSPPPSQRMSLGPRAGRAQHRAPHRRGGVRARRRGSLRRRREARSTSSATCCSRSTSSRCCWRSAAPGTSPRSPRRRARSSSAATRTSSETRSWPGCPPTRPQQPT